MASSTIVRSAFRAFVFSDNTTGMLFRTLAQAISVWSRRHVEEFTNR